MDDTIGSSEMSALSIAAIRELARGTGPDQALIDKLEADPRAGVKAIAKQLRRSRDKLEKQRARQEELREIEKAHHAAGRALIAGVDEAGRGPLAGPVVAASVILPPDADLPGLDDSKKLSHAKREQLYDEIIAQALHWGIGMVDSEEIDNTNILVSAMKAMRGAVKNMKQEPDIALIDGNHLPGLTCDERALIDGDARCLSIAAASILAKVTRDRIMVEMDAVYPGYGFSSHKGYGAESHVAAIRQLGPSDIHRLTFKIVTRVAPAGTAARILTARLENAPSKKTFNAVVRSISHLRDYMKKRDVEELREVYRRCSSRFE